MRKIIFQISIILLIMAIGMISVFITKVNADSMAGLSCPSSVEEGKDFTVALILPSNAYSAQANITIKYSNGATSTRNLVYLSGMGDFPNSVTFTAKAAGNATVTASNIVISDSNATTLEPNGSKSASINITSKTPADNNNNSNNNNNNNNNANNNAEVKFSDVNETVYTTDRCNVRKSYSTNSDKLATLEIGTSLKRTGVSNTGWSRVSYNGQTAYISSQYLTTTQVEIKFKDVNEKLYATQDCNLRKSWSTDSERVGYLTAGQEVTRTGIADNGWSRINNNGQVVYVATRLLTTEKPEENPDEDPEEIEDVEKTEQEILAEIKEEVGILPEVGNNLAIIMHICVVIITLCGVSVGIYYRTK